LTAPFFIPFSTPIEGNLVPEKFTLMRENQAHPLCVLAVEELQNHLTSQQDWSHNFGFDANDTRPIIGKMFGVLVVKNEENKLGYLSAFSGKIAGANHHKNFVPPVFDTLSEDSFLTKGMIELSKKKEHIETLKKEKTADNQLLIEQLLVERKKFSLALQRTLFDHYFFLNQAKISKSVYEIFETANYLFPPSGAGECATPKLLQYAFLHDLKPIALAEFWWGQSPKSNNRKHGHFYPCCKEKCHAILAHMLSGLECVYE
jgi:tRNA pseudouridine32 synthase / 23S rRNA pseudouridine746 synthase